MARPVQDRDLELEDLLSLGCSQELARRILDFLGEGDVLRHYVSRAAAQGCVPVTRVSEAYPDRLRRQLGTESPGCLWAKGDLSILAEPAIALVGSRDLDIDNQVFARQVGNLAAQRGLVLVSGNARGADKIAQEACLKAGGKVISIVADQLCSHPERNNLLYLSEDGYAEPFCAQRALSRNRCIHALGQITFVAQCGLEKGGTWHGTVNNLRHGWSDVVCCRDGSAASRELERRGATLMTLEELKNVSLEPDQQSFFEE
jgi:predicted Rossmann fold nucleotide-binding protein DprA/Smf involved in DNA uptake